MPVPSRRAARPLAFCAALFGAVLLAPSNAPAQGIDFGRAAGEDRLLGHGSPVGPAVAPARQERFEHRERRLGGGRHDDRRSGHRLSGDRRTPSVIFISTAPRSTYFRGTGVFANANGGGGSVLYYAPERGRFESEPGPKIIDVEEERLDRRPIGPGGMTVHYSGSTKIIRLAPGYRLAGADGKDMAALPEPAPESPPPLPERAPRAAPAEQPAASPEAAAPAPEAPAPVPAPAPATPADEPQPPSAAEGPSFEPWTAEWLEDCVARHESFDATLGTYVDEDGRRRFCTGDPA